MFDEHARGARSKSERKRGTSARLAMLVAALVLVIGGCGLADAATKSRTDSMRSASWPGADADDGALGSVAVVHTGTPSPEPTMSPSSFFGAYDPSPDDVRDPADGEAPRAPDRILWPLPAPDETDEPDYGELGHSPEPDPGTDPCDAVGVLPDECDPEPEPDPSPCDDSADGCDPPDCDDPDGCEPPDCDDPDGCEPPDCDDPGDGEPTSEPTDPGDGSGAGEPTPDPTGTAEPTQTPAPAQSPDPTPTDPPDEGEPGC